MHAKLMTQPQESSTEALVRIEKCKQFVFCVLKHWLIEKASFKFGTGKEMTQGRKMDILDISCHEPSSADWDKG